MAERIDQIKAVSSAVRIEILQLLDEPETNFSHQESASPEDFGVCINLIAERLGLSQPTTSRHIELLRRAGFLRVRRQQKWSYCSRDEESLANYYNWLQGQLNIKSA